MLGLAVGLGCGYFMAARRGSAGRARQLEAQLTTARQELDDYRSEVVAQFSETARKFQTLNDSYTDLHEQLAKSSSVLCGDVTGPLLQAPNGHQDLIPAEIRDELDTLAAGANGPKAQKDQAQKEEVAEEIRVAEPKARAATSGDAKPDADSPTATNNTAPSDAKQKTEPEGPKESKGTEEARRAAGAGG
ncbi:MAG: DUF1043 family protein [Gammaproteobacteria bacterium]|nr:DUF1043 family protein [Gammaproteobacteria bacterium]